MNPRRSASLPICDIADALPAALAARGRLIVQAPTGSGKSTQIPQILLDSGRFGDGRIVVLQPRRMAARMLAKRVAWERGVSLGDEVGYHVRFDKRCGEDTRIRFETDGITLRRMLDDSRIEDVSVLVFDEFHERHLYTDILLGLALRAQRTTRPDLRIVVMSATLEARRLESFLAPCDVREAGGRMFPVDTAYLDRPLNAEREPVWDAAAAAVDRAMADQPEGDALIFMPGAYEIRRTIDAIRRTPAGGKALLFPLHGELPPEQQDAAVADTDRRKIVVATNVAETSLTIPGIRIVVDCGLARRARFDPHRGINTLLIEKISQASAEQRAGRAGRTAPGLCIRLWTARDHAQRPAAETPEIKCVDLAETMLLLKCCGVEDMAAFPWLDAPEPGNLERATRLLTEIGGLDRTGGQVTPFGRKLAAFPVHPRDARMLLASGPMGCSEDAALVAALLQERSILLPAQNRSVRDALEKAVGDETGSDLLFLMQCWKHAAAARFDGERCRSVGISEFAARKVESVYRQFLALTREHGLAGNGASDPSAMAKCILTAYSDRVARLASTASRRYDVVNRRRGTLAQDSVVRSAPLLVAADIDEVERSGGEIDVRLSQATAIRTEWLDELFAEDMSVRRSVGLDPASKRVVAREERLFRDLMIETGRITDATEEEAAVLLAQEVMKGNLVLKGWDHAVEQWVLRLEFLHKTCPDLGLPAFGPDERRHLLEHVCHGAFSYKEIKERPVWPLLRRWLAPPQQVVLDRHAPERLTLTNGRNPKVVYEAQATPYVAMRIQELFGVMESPRIAMGRVRVAVRILAPSSRPVQITDDLTSFWKDAYPRVKKELQRKYPRHEWR